MIIDTTNDELLINGQRWQRGGYLLATAYSTDQINITARDGRVIGKAIEWDRILDKDKNTFGLDRDGTVTALTNIFNSQVKSPYKIDALRDVENGTAAYGEIMIYRSPGEWQYEVLEQYHGAYDSEAATLRSGATATLELYYTAQADGDGISELSQSNTPASGYQIIRKLYYAERAQQDPDTGTWVQFAALDPNTTYASAKATLLAYLKERTGGTVPISLKMTWEEELEPTLLLDTYTGAAAAYSLRKLRTAYSGSAIRVRRASDNAEQDIGFSSGELDTAALASFCSGTDGFVKVWYDQGQGGNDATQTITASQPQIVSSGSMVLNSNGNATLSFASNMQFRDIGASISTAPHSAFCVAEGNSSLEQIYGFGAGAAFNHFELQFHTTSLTIAYVGNGGSYNTHLSSASTDGNTHLLTSIYDATTLDLYIEGSLDYSNSETNTSSSKLSLGARGSGGYNMSEFVLYSSDQSSNREGIETNINTFYSIY